MDDVGSRKLLAVTVTINEIVECFGIKTANHLKWGSNNSWIRFSCTKPAAFMTIL